MEHERQHNRLQQQEETQSTAKGLFPVPALEHNLQMIRYTPWFRYISQSAGMHDLQSSKADY
jgi:hypothetical protein